LSAQVLSLKMLQACVIKECVAVRISVTWFYLSIPVPGC